MRKPLRPPCLLCSSNKARLVFEIRGRPEGCSKFDLLVFVGNALFESIEIEGVPDVFNVDLGTRRVRSRSKSREVSRPQTSTYLDKELVTFEFDEPRDPAAVTAAL